MKSDLNTISGQNEIIFMKVFIKQSVIFIFQEKSEQFVMTRIIPASNPIAKVMNGIRFGRHLI
jgi:hypothetical protein